jgi:hypothetical protein
MRRCSEYTRSLRMKGKREIRNKGLAAAKATKRALR